MILDAQVISLGAALLAGLVGSTHCFAMCGGLSAAFGLRSGVPTSTHFAAARHAIVVQLGRIASYTLAGAVAGSIGASAHQLLDLSRIAGVLRIAAGLVLIAVALRMAGARNLLAPIERLGSTLWTTIAPLVRHTTRPGMLPALGLGMVWGFLPCGLTYSMLLYAALADTTWQGAAILLAFGAGTLPSMLMGNFAGARIAQWLRARSWRLAAAGLMASFGALTIFAVLSLPHHHH